MAARGFRVRALGEVAIRVRAMAPMIAFYRDVIGLEVLRGTEADGIVFFRIADGFDGHTAVLALFAPDQGDLKLHPQGVPVPGGGSSTLHHLALSLPRDEQDAAVAWYDRLGLDYQVQEFGWIGWRGVFTRDPEGNTVELVAFDARLLEGAA